MVMSMNRNGTSCISSDMTFLLNSWGY
uniref:Uncharacterized protein n=1 Tax=Anguilla anguilla TaxID=7936 RepID=A0A0E9VGA8_ANGAN